jgi:ribosomal protein L11 methyltransferase
MSYHREIVIEVDRQHAEPLSDALLELGALSVSVEDADADTPHEQPLFGEPGLEPDRAAWAHSRVIALLAPEHDPTVLLAAATNAVGLNEDGSRMSAGLNDTGLRVQPSFTVRDIPEQDWVQLTQSQFEPIHIGQRIWVVPSWHEAPQHDAVVLELDPGLAFGTGSHPTTRLCMEWIEQYVHAGDSLLDYGCGSGILAILARKLDAAPVIGIDIDPQALDSARHNSERNHVDIVYGLPEDCPTNVFDVVVANILSNPLKLMASMLASKVKPGGRLVLSGVLARQADEVAAAYAPYINLSVWREYEGWVCLTGQR